MLANRPVPATTPNAARSLCYHLMITSGTIFGHLRAVKMTCQEGDPAMPSTGYGHPDNGNCRRGIELEHSFPGKSRRSRITEDNALSTLDKSISTRDESLDDETHNT